jgi:hypothetical protein
MPPIRVIDDGKSLKLYHSLLYGEIINICYERCWHLEEDDGPDAFEIGRDVIYVRDEQDNLVRTLLLTGYSDQAIYTVVWSIC